MSFPDLVWQCGGARFVLGARALVMGILNVTPDSFSDGGRYATTDAAVAGALQMAGEGADILDIGGESSRPGSEPVPEDEQIRRVIPVLRGIRAAGCALPVSIDTTSSAVAAAALEYGANILNDISALRDDPAMARLAADSGAGVVLMHMRGAPKTMQQEPRYEDVAREVREFLDERVRFAVEAGVRLEQICLDPGIGFGKRLDHNLALIRSLADLRTLGRPILLGVSRKAFIGGLTGASDPKDRLEGSLAAGVAGILRGADILRVHDVRPSRLAADVAVALR